MFHLVLLLQLQNQAERLQSDRLKALNVIYSNLTVTTTLDVAYGGGYCRQARMASSLVKAERSGHGARHKALLSRVTAERGTSAFDQT